jgi:hypothetical protein
LKERTLGVCLFQRDPAYDTSDDAIVRVTASDVRKRLLQFYRTTTTHSNIRITLASGSYIVQFSYEADPAFIEVQPTAVEPQLAAPVIANTPASRLPWRFVVASLAAALFALILWLGFQPDFTATNSLPWSVILRKSHPLKIVLSDPNIATFQNLFGYRLSLADYAARRYLPETASLPTDAGGIFRILRGDNVAAVDAATTLRIGAVVPPARIQTFRARTLQSSDFRTDDNFILMGSPISNPWVGLFQDQLDFEFWYDPERREEVIRNKRPAQGELSVYPPTVPGWGTGHAYAIAAFLANPNQSGRVMILSGSNAAATEAVGKFVADPELVARTLKARGFDPHNDKLQFEMLLRVTTVNASLNTFDVIACHSLSRASAAD